MKKFFLSLLIALMAVSAEAQVTWNVRAGVGGMEDDNVDGSIAPRLSVQSNIPFGSNSRWVFSPAVGGSVAVNNGGFHVDFPLLFGYKATLGRRNALFIPKLGPVLGYSTNGNGSAIVGPSVEFAFEIGHFVAAVSGYYSLVKGKNEWRYNYTDEFEVFNIFLSFGYKF